MKILANTMPITLPSCLPKVACYSLDGRVYYSTFLSFLCWYSKLSPQYFLEFSHSEVGSRVESPRSSATILLNMNTSLICVGAIHALLFSFSAAAVWMVDPESCDVGEYGHWVQRVWHISKENTDHL